MNKLKKIKEGNGKPINGKYYVGCSEFGNMMNEQSHLFSRSQKQFIPYKTNKIPLCVSSKVIGKSSDKITDTINKKLGKNGNISSIIDAVSSNVINNVSPNGQQFEGHLMPRLCVNYQQLSTY